MAKNLSPQTGANDVTAYLAGFLCLLVYAGSLLFPLMDKDAAHHANIALRMYEHNDYVSLVDRGNDYLDKPHFLFWTSLVSFKIFGINTFAHRFPALLFALLSLFSTYRLALHLSNKQTARLAALMLATAQAFVLSVVDARMETPLTAGIIFGLWHLIVYIDKQKWLNLILAALGAAIAFSTKGWLGPVIMFSAGFFHLALQRKWRVLISPKTWVFIPLFFLMISPVLYAYYLQYDLHPEKVIRGQSNRSGIYFILWDQLFERYKGFDEGGRNSHYFFLYHTFLWAFFPWCIFAYAGLVFWIRRMVMKRKWRHPFNFAALAFAFLLVTISFSKFKMPHYIIMLLPLAALFTAPYVRYILSTTKGIRIYYPIQFVLTILVLLVTLALNFYFFPPVNIMVWVAGIILLFSFGLLLARRFYNRAYKIVFMSAGVALVFNFFLMYNFFPQLLTYQGGNEMVKRMEKEQIHVVDSSIILLEPNAHSFDFYRNRNHPLIDVAYLEKNYDQLKDNYFLLTRSFRDHLDRVGFRVEPLISQPDYNVATIRLSFLNPATRTERADTLMLARVYRK